MAPVLFPDIGIVTCGDEVAPQIVCPTQQGRPLDMRVTQNTWVRSSSAGVVFDKAINHPAPEILPNVDDEVLEPVADGDLPGIVHRFHRDRKSTRLNSSHVAIS